MAELKRYVINYHYEGVGSGIVPKYVDAENEIDAVRKLIEEEKEKGNKVIAINGVWLWIDPPRGGWMNPIKEKEDGR